MGFFEPFVSTHISYLLRKSSLWAARSAPRFGRLVKKVKIVSTSKLVSPIFPFFPRC